MTKPTQTFTSDERRLTLTALMIVFLLGALDQTIVATAMPRIAAQLRGLNLYAWVTTAYLLTSTVMVPIWGKLSDLHGRKPVLLWGIGIFLVGSWLSGLSGEFGPLPLLGGGMSQLIVFRAIQGVGGGALFTTAFAIVADMFGPRERGRYSGMFGASFGLAGVIGPVAGGFFTDHATVHAFGHVIEGWRFIFYLNLPLTLLSMFMITARMPALPHRGGGEVDYLGAGLIVAAFAPLMLAMSWGGQDYGWTSPTIIGLLVFSVLALIALVLVERRVAEPMIPLELFSDRVFATANSASFIVNMAFMGVGAFLPLFMQVALRMTATESGLALLPMMFGMVFASGLTGYLVTRTGLYKPFMLGGGIVLMAGLVLLTAVSAQTSFTALAWRLLIVGIGLGPAQSLFTLAVQNAAPPRQLGVATSGSQFVRQIGATIGVAFYGAILTHDISGELARRSPPGVAHQAVDVSQLQAMALGEGLPTAPGANALAMLDATRDSFAAAFVNVFQVGLVAITLSVVITLFIPVLRMRSRAERMADAEAAAAAAE